MEIFHVNLSNPCSGILKSTCNTACAFWDSYEKFKKAGVEVVGITGDDSSSHKRAKTQKNKATAHHLGLLKAKLAKLRRELLTPTTKGGGGAGEGSDVTKSGDARVGLVGFPSVGKSTLLNKLTGTFSEVASYEFATLTCIPGVITYRGAKIQVYIDEIFLNLWFDLAMELALSLESGEVSECETSESSQCDGNSSSKNVLDAFFLGKALAETLNERIESTVGELSSTVGRLQAEQQRQVHEFQYEPLSNTGYSSANGDTNPGCPRTIRCSTIVDDFFDVGSSQEEHENLIQLVEKYIPILS
ncbi:Thioredoxin superfamily protein [Trifolium repens]|nr:Thioredoxin superfamily protein [Trifolium repens]